MTMTLDRDHWKDGEWHDVENYDDYDDPEDEDRTYRLPATETDPKTQYRYSYQDPVTGKFCWSEPLNWDELEQRAKEQSHHYDGGWIQRRLPQT